MRAGISRLYLLLYAARCASTSCFFFMHASALEDIDGDKTSSSQRSITRRAPHFHSASSETLYLCALQIHSSTTIASSAARTMACPYRSTCTARLAETGVLNGTPLVPATTRARGSKAHIFKKRDAPLCSSAVAICCTPLDFCGQGSRLLRYPHITLITLEADVSAECVSSPPARSEIITRILRKR